MVNKKKTERFQQFIENPGEIILDPDETFFQNIIREYPYFQSAHLLMTLAQNQNKSIFFNKKLEETAIYSGDRAALYELIHKPLQEQTKRTDQSGEKVTSKEKPAKLPSGSSHDLSDDQLLKEIRERSSNKVQKKASKTSREPTSKRSSKSLHEKHTFSEWLDHLSKKQISPKKQKAGKLTGQKQKEVNQLLDEFIKKEPRIKKPRSKFYDPVDKARESVKEDENLVSETLAKINIRQGNYSAAIKIYEKLSLLYPDKFNYFAPKIEALKEKLKE